MSSYELILKSIEEYIEKCAKPKSSSNYNDKIPWDYNINDEFTDLEDILEKFRESDPYGNMFTNLDIKQRDAQNYHTDFTERQETYLVSYFNKGYWWINGLINDSESFYQNFTQKLIRQYREELPTAIHNLDGAIANSMPLKQDTVLYSSVRIDETLGIGEIGNWKSYVSTSFSKDGMLVSSNKKDYSVKILAMEGVKGVCGNGKMKHNIKENEGFQTLNKRMNESEYLLGRNTKYMLLSKNDDTREAIVLVF